MPSSSVLSPTFVIGSIRIGSVEGASCVNMGNNWTAGFESHKKLNQGFGSVSGDNNAVRDSRSLLNDSDFLDMMFGSQSDVPDWMKDMMTAKSSDKAGSDE